MKKQLFGNIYGKEVYKFTLTDGKVSAEIVTYGGAVRALYVPDKDGKIKDVVLGYETLEEYRVNDGYLGALIGRVGNRIGKGKFSLNGREYVLAKNDNGKNSLHGGNSGFNDKVWDYEIIGEKLKLSYVSADGEEGFPAELKVSVVYSVEDGALKIEYEAVSDGDTVINLTNHSYFNLDGEGSGDILDTVIRIDADKITPTDKELITHGDFMSVENTPHDFREPKKIGKDIDCKTEQLEFAGGFDTNYVLNGTGFRNIATAVGTKSGIVMDVYSDQAGVQFYSGNFLGERKGKNGSVYNKRGGFCLETQGFPNAVNCQEYPSQILKKGDKYRTVTAYRFR